MDEIEPRDVGRPSKFSPAMGEEICRRIMEGKSLNSICSSDPDLPYIGTVLRWVLDGECNKTPELKNFAISYKEAMDVRTEMLFDELIDLADCAANDKKMNHLGEMVVDQDHIQRVKLQIDTRFKYASKLKPRKYGERTTLAGDADAPLQITGIKIELVPGVKE